MLLLLIFGFQYINADDGIRNCTKDNLIGNWTISHIKVFDNTATNDLSHLLMKNQILVFKDNNELRSLYSNNNSKDMASYLKLLEIPQGDTFKIKDGVISIYQNNKQIDACQCQYFTKELKNANIEKGSISLMRFSKGKLAIGNLYKKVNP